MREGLRAGRGRQPYVYKCITTMCKNTERASESSAKPSATQRGDTEWEKNIFLIYTYILLPYGDLETISIDGYNSCMQRPKFVFYSKQGKLDFRLGGEYSLLFFTQLNVYFSLCTYTTIKKKIYCISILLLLGLKESRLILTLSFPSIIQIDLLSTWTMKMIYWMGQNDPVEEELASQAAALLKRSKSHQFYGLMGKRSGKNLCLVLVEKHIYVETKQ